MKFTISFFLLTIIALSPSFSQNIETWLENQEPTHFEKLYIHTDREFYFEGDTIWFAAYLLDGQSHIPSDTDCNLYIDIINGNGEIVQNNLFLVQKGICSGNIDLNRRKIREGNFMIRAYTDYLKNFGNDAFFTKNIQVSTIKNAFNGVDKIIQESNKTDIQFCPGTFYWRKVNCFFNSRNPGGVFFIFIWNKVKLTCPFVQAFKF